MKKLTDNHPVYISESLVADKILVIETDESKMRLTFDQAKDIAERLIQWLEKNTGYYTPPINCPRPGQKHLGLHCPCNDVEYCDLQKDRKRAFIVSFKRD